MSRQIELPGFCKDIQHKSDDKNTLGVPVMVLKDEVSRQYPKLLPLETKICYTEQVMMNISRSTGDSRKDSR
jgi:hypothetical protein